MKKKEIRELREKTLAELGKMLKEKQSGLVKLRMEIATQKIKNIRVLARTRDDLARIMTVINQKELEEK